MRIDNRTDIPTKLISEIMQEVSDLEHVRVENVPVIVKYSKYMNFTGTAHTYKKQISKHAHLDGLHVDAGYIHLGLAPIRSICIADFLDKKSYLNKLLDITAFPVYLRNLIFLIAHEFSHIRDAQQCKDILPEHRRMRHDNRPHEIEANRWAEHCLVCLLERKDVIERWQGYLRAAWYDSI